MHESDVLLDPEFDVSPARAAELLGQLRALEQAIPELATLTEEPWFGHTG